MDYGGLWTDITSRWPSPTRLALPPVEHIRIIDEALCMSNYLTCFPTSASDRFYYRFTIFDENSPSIANNIRQLAVLDLMSQVSSLIGAPVAYLDFADIIADCRPSHQLDFVASVASPFADSQTIPSLNLILDCIISRPDAHLRCLETLFDGLGGQLAHVRKLMLFGVDPYMSIDWARPFECMRNLRELVVSADEPDDIIELLGSLTTEHRDERTGVTARELYFPALERITFSGMAREDERLDSVAQSLQKRMDLGSPLPVLVMYMVEDPLQPDDERLLSRVVSSLVSLNQMPGDTRPEIVNFVP
ncbi:hypothetical protein EWM64_g2188 [Hericium alpestre]|uniref:Uncharacterized protein n=1 Tax=Hericium alpestre TaxID=135208 RepID=A0A4Z0A631_9AGAM|nr:hypothetical protein EWM64_g2188 [Hericium alpestre]